MTAEATETLSPNDLVPIELDYLKPGEEMKFPILQMSNGLGEYVLLLNKNQKFTDRLRSSIQNARDTRIFTKRRNLLDYERYVESRMKETLADESIPLEKRSEVLYTEVSRVMNGVLEKEVAEDSLTKASQFGRHVSSFMSSNAKAVRSMMSITIKDYFVFTHSIHVCIYGLGLFLRTTKPETAIHLANDVALGFLFHDVGKTRIDRAILNKPGALTQAEWGMVKRHPQWGCDILKRADLAKPAILDITLSHHERMNGKGYPQGLKGPALSPLAKIAGVVDTFDAMTTHRPHKEGMSVFDALQQMKKENEESDLFDRELFEAFVRMMAE